MKARIPGANNQSMNQMLKQYQQMQEKMTSLQSELEEREYSATSGGGMIEVTVDGKHSVKSINIKPEAVDPDDVEMLEDLLIVAINEAIEKASKNADDEMSALTGGMNLPGMF